MKNTLIREAVKQLRDNQNGDNWYGESFEKKLDPVNSTMAFNRPIPEVHTLAELAAHLLTWRLEGIKMLQGDQPKVTVDSPENWRTNEELKKIGWEKLKRDLFNSQVELIEFIENKPDDFLIGNDYVPGYSYKYLVDRLIHHDIYHLGQIGITLKLIKKEPKENEVSLH